MDRKVREIMATEVTINLDHDAVKDLLEQEAKRRFPDLRLEEIRVYHNERWEVNHGEIAVNVAIHLTDEQER